MTRMGHMLAIVAVVLIGAAVVPGVVAAEQRSGGTVVVGTNETVTEDLTASGGAIIVEGTVEGNLTAIGGSVVVTESGTITGNLTGTVGDISIDGAVNGTVTGSVGSIRIGETATVGNVDAESGYLGIEGTVTGDVRAAVDRLELGPAATIGGDLTYDDETTVIGDADAVVAGSVEATDLGHGRGGGGLIDAILPGFFLLVDLAFGAVLLIVLPRLSEDIASTLTERPLYTAGGGVAGVLGTVVFPLILALTIVGLPIALVFGPTVAIVGGWVAVVYGKYTIGRWVLAQVDVDDRWLALIVGMVGFAALGMVPLVGIIFGAVPLVIGVGAILLALYDRYRAAEPSAPSIARRL
ncbi:MAG: polymer-forming cytoskeletal protein [Halococcoides sp.]